MKRMNAVINKDISKIREEVFWGMPLRETILGGATIAIGIIVHTKLGTSLNSSDAVNIITGLACIPTGFLFLYKYQGLPGEKIVLEIFRSLFLKKTMVLSPENRYNAAVRNIIKKRQKEGLKNDKAIRNAEKKSKRKKTKL